MDRRHLAHLYRAAGLAGAQGKAERFPNPRHRGSRAGRAAGGVARRPARVGRRRSGDDRRLPDDDQRPQLGGVLDPISARAEAAPGSAYDVLRDGFWLGLHHAAFPAQSAVRGHAPDALGRLDQRDFPGRFLLGAGVHLLV